jgi:hypothetical protein
MRPTADKRQRDAEQRLVLKRLKEDLRSAQR